MVRAFHHPSADELTLDRILHALSDSTRRDIVMKLLAKGSMNCGAACGTLPPSTISHHHRILREAGLICSERKGVEVVNSARRSDIDRRFPGLLDAILSRHGA